MSSGSEVQRVGGKRASQHNVMICKLIDLRCHEQPHLCVFDFQTIRHPILESLSSLAGREVRQFPEFPMRGEADYVYIYIESSFFNERILFDMLCFFWNQIVPAVWDR